MYSYHQSILDIADSCGISCTLQYRDIHRSVCGFFCNLVFDDQKAFSCPTHGTSPKFIVSDGKALGPLKRKVSHLKELDHAVEDNTTLAQSTHFSNRTFLCQKKERALVCKLVTGDLSMQEFIVSGDLVSENGHLVSSLVSRIAEVYPFKIPAPYVSFLSNISKNSSTRSLLQVTNLEVIDHLRDYCQETLDLRNLQNEKQLKQVLLNLPALWPILNDISRLERTNYLPREVSRIVLKLLTIRVDTFENCTRRSNSDYFLYPTTSPTEHPTQCYPTMPIWRYPSRYIVSQQVDSDLCDKTFTYHGDFCAGVYSVGCGCDSGITFGFELMLLKESPRNLFRFLMCRDVDLNSLEGILVDHACLFEPYTLNREAKLLEKVLVLVDGSHWSGQKKLKKPDTRGRGGHLGYV